MIFPRSSWQMPSNPVIGAHAVPSEWRYVTLHWPGGNCSGNSGAVLRAMQASWTRVKHYSLGYNFAVFPDGNVYEIRGFDIRCAANGNQAVNRPGVAILLAVPNVDTPPTPAMIRGVREVVDATRMRVPQRIIVNAHRDIRPEPTQCCGDVIVRMIRAGAFEPDVPPPTTEETTGMIFRTHDTGDAIFVQGSDYSIRHITAFEGAVAGAADPGWAEAAPRLTLPDDVTAWLASL